MADILDLAKAFLSIEPMTNKKLQKLCFYAKAWHLAIYDEDLINEKFEAWVHGAVNPELYHEYKEFGYSDIPQYTGSMKGIPEEFIEFANEIYESYGEMTGNELEALNHTEDPWINAREGYRPWERCTVEISKNDMKEYYRKQMI